MEDVGLRAAMTMPAESSRIVDDSVTGTQDADEHFMIAAGPRWRTGIEAFIEFTNDSQQLSPNRHIRAGADRSHGQRVVTLSVENPAPEAPTEGAVLLEQLLRLGLELQRQCQSCHAHHAAVHKVREEGIQPLWLDDRIVVGESHNLAGRFTNTTVTSSIEARARFTNVARARETLHNTLAGVRTGCVVYHDQFVAFEVQAAGCKQRFAQILGAIPECR